MKASQRAYESILKMIQSGEIKDSVVENDLTDILNTSRTPVREAIARLIVEGWVEVLDNGSKVVCKITVDQAREIYQVRISLEALLLKLAWSEIDRSLMQQLQDHTLDVITHENFEDMSEVLGKFYTELYAKSNNKLLAESITVLHNKVNLIKVDLINQVKKASCDEIMKLFQAIIDNDQQKANLRLEQHLMGSYYRLFGEL